MLISRGHRLGDVLEVYTMSQVRAFVRAAEMGRSDEFLMRASAARAAMQNDRDWKKFVRDHKQAQEASRPRREMTRQDAERLKALLGGKKSG